MTPVELIDDAARNRISRDGLDELLFVEAGAGTGKTKQLVDRVVALVLERGVAMRDIAAITFTEAAASELRSRVREAFERRLHDAREAVASGATVGDAGLEAACDRCEAALADLDGAAIGTVHSFAQRILSEHPIEAGLPPMVEVLDEVESLLEFEGRWQEHVDRMFAAPDLSAVLALARTLGIRVDDDQLASLRDVAVNFSDNWDRLDRIAQTPVELPRINREPARAATGAVARLLEQCAAIDHDSLAQHVLGCAGEIAYALDTLGVGTDRAVLRVVDAKVKWKQGNKGQAPNWGGKEGKAAVVEVLAAADDAFRGLKQDMADRVLVVLAGEVARFTIRAAQERQREGRLEFHDLLVLAQRLLRNSPDARRALSRRYRRLLVDEFQDTDPIQIELATLIAASVEPVDPQRGDPDVPIGAWTDVAVDPERLFFVGDPKQSIYRFRRADIELFLTARDRFAGESVRLTTNFRTVSPILGWVNHVFGSLMPDEVPGRQPRYEALAGHRGDGPNDHRVVAVGGPHAKQEKLKAGSLREIEAGSIADAIAGILLDPEQWPVEDGGGWRAARPEDIAILVPTRTSLPILMDALRDRGVEFRAETGTLVYETQELRDLLAMLRAVAHGADAVALVAALRSPILACGDDDLVTYRHAGGRWDLEAPRPELSDDHPVIAAMQYLSGLRAQRWWTSPSEMLERVVADRAVLALALGTPRARDVWRRVRFLIDQARLYEASQSGDLVGFVAWADLQRSGAARVHEPLLPEADDHAVRIMTIHGAKGLEFPITVLSGLTTQLGRRRPGLQIHWNGDAVELSTKKGVQTAAFDRRADLEAEMDDEEKLRLFYVACTRARDHLVVAMHHIEGTKSFARIAWDATQSAPPSSWRVAPVEGAPLGLVSAPASAKPFGTDLAARAEWITRRTALLEQGRVARTFSATELRRTAGSQESFPMPTGSAAGAAGAAHDPDGDDSMGDDSMGDGREVWRRGRAATAFGRAVHAVLQNVELATGRDLHALAVVAANIEGLADHTDEVAAAARSVLAAETVRQAAVGESFREMYVAAPVEDRVIEGYIDLLVRTPDGLVVVDYKTDAVANANDIDALVEEYRPQLAAYALAVEITTGQPVVAGVLVFTGSAERAAIERRIVARELGIASVRAILSA